MRALFAGFIGPLAAAVAAAGLVGAGEGAWAGRDLPVADLSCAAAWTAGLYVPIGLLAGLVLWALRRIHIFARIRSWSAGEPPEEVFAVACSAGLCSFGLLVALHHVAYHFFTAYHNATLASFALSVSIMVLCGVTVIAHALLRASLRWLGRRLQRPRRAAVVAFAASWLVPALFGLVTGTTGGSGGVFGFWGVLKKDELDLRPFALVGMVVVVALLLRVVAGHRPKVLASVACAFVGAFAATLLTYGARPAAADLLDRRGLLGRLVLIRARQAFDRDGDGYSAALGGGDCDDRRRSVYPGADEKAGNGIDEDCSGNDLRTERPARPARSAAIATTRPTAGLSIVLITVDTLRADLGYTGYARAVSPSIDRLARRAIRYDRAYALSSYTGKALAPMFIGRYPTECQRDDQHFTRYFSENVFLAERLAESGYKTGAVLPHWYFRKSSGLAQGFERWDLEAIPRGPGHIDVQSSSPDVTQRALVMLGDASFTRGRFFLWVHYLDPHREYLPHDGIPAFGTTRRDLYDGEVAFTDRHLGRLLEFIEHAGWSDRTAIVLTSDHGEAFGEHDVLFHGRDLWDEMIRVPLLFAVPGLRPRIVERRVSHIDFAPTLYDLSGVDAPEGLSGQSLLPELSGTVLPEREVYAELPPGPYNDDRRVLIHDGWKLHYIAAGNRMLLFHIDEDPGELDELSGREPAKLRSMMERLAAHRAGLDRVAPKANGETQ